MAREAHVRGGGEGGWCGDRQAGFESHLGLSPGLPFTVCVTLGAALSQGGVGIAG